LIGGKLDPDTHMLHTNTVFDELGLFKGNNKLLILTHRNNQKSTKEDKS
jgi:hypothetical protein